MATRKSVALTKPSVVTKTAAKRGTTVEKKVEESLEQKHGVRRKFVKPAAGKQYVPDTAIPADLKAPAKQVKAATGNAPKTAGAKKIPTLAKKADKPRKIVRTSLGNISVALKPAAKAKKPSTDIKFRGFVIPAGRKSGDSEEGVPTIQLRKVADISKLLDKLPKGAFVSASAQHVISVFNKPGMLIAELHTYDSTNNG